MQWIEKHKIQTKQELHILRLPPAELLEKLDRKYIWHSEPVYCFTADADWASEAALELFLSDVEKLALKMTLFITNASETIDDYHLRGIIERGIHPNFLSGSSHGDDFRTVLETCFRFAPEAKCSRSHRGFDVTDTSHLLAEYGIEYDSNIVSIMYQSLGPILHESGLLRFPIFFEDGTHLYNRFDLSIDKFRNRFTSPGIKVISTHPMNWVINPPELKYMRSIKDNLNRQEYNFLDIDAIEKYRYRGIGINQVLKEIIQLSRQYRVMSLSELYAAIID